jgi:adenylate cyclase
LLSKALALDPNYADAHEVKALVLESQFRFDEAIAEDQRAADLNPTNVYTYENMAFAYRLFGQFEPSLEFVDKAIRLSPRDPLLWQWYADKASAHLALKQYDQAIEWARRAIAINPNNVFSHIYLIVALALTRQETHAREGFERYLAVPGAFATMATLKQVKSRFVNEHTDPRYVEYWDRLIEGLRKAGLQG